MTESSSKRRYPQDLFDLLLWAWERRRFNGLAADLSPYELADVVEHFVLPWMRMKEKAQSVWVNLQWHVRRICGFGNHHSDLSDTFTDMQTVVGAKTRDGSLMQWGTTFTARANRRARRRLEKLDLMAFEPHAGPHLQRAKLNAPAILRYAADAAVAWMSTQHGDDWHAEIRKVAARVDSHRTAKRPMRSDNHVSDEVGQLGVQGHRTAKRPTTAAIADSSTAPKQQQRAAAARSWVVGSFSGPQLTSITKALQEIGHATALPATLATAAARLTKEQAAGIAIRLQELHAEGTLRSPVAALRIAVKDPDTWQPHGTDLAKVKSPLVTALRETWLSWLRTTPSARDLQELARGLLGTDLQKVCALREYGMTRHDGTHDYGDPSRPITVKGILEHAAALRRSDATREDHRAAVRQTAARVGVTFDDKGKAEKAAAPILVH